MGVAGLAILIRLASWSRADYESTRLARFRWVRRDPGNTRFRGRRLRFEGRLSHPPAKEGAFRCTRGAFGRWATPFGV